VNTYFLGINLAVAKVKQELSHEGSNTLDEINAFDLAETTTAYIGQINMIKASSFCGPNSLIWGLDVCKTEKKVDDWNIINKIHKNSNIKIYSLDSLVSAFKELTGSGEERHFPFLSGSPVPCAKKIITKEGENIVYAALALGIPKNRNYSACLLMENVGTIPLDIEDIQSYKKNIIEKLINSVIAIGENQKIKYKKIFIDLNELKIEKGEIGCSLIAAPYFSLAKDAVPIYLKQSCNGYLDFTPVISKNLFLG
jgi:histidine decarboxylase